MIEHAIDPRGFHHPQRVFARDALLGADDLAGVVARVNRLLYEVSSANRYATFFFARYSPATRQLSYVNAGHNPPLVLPAEAGLPAQASLNPGAMRLLESTGVPLGLFPEVSHEVKTEALDPGTLVVLYSDGITEARNSGGNAYGVDRLVGLVSREREKPAEELVDRILEDVRAFSGDAPTDDDQTLVVLKVNPPFGRLRVLSEVEGRKRASRQKFGRHGREGQLSAKKMIERSRIESLLADLVRIESINPDLVEGGSGEGEIARFVADYLSRAGLESSCREIEPADGAKGILRFAQNDKRSRRTKAGIQTEIWPSWPRGPTFSEKDDRAFENRKPPRRPSED